MKLYFVFMAKILLCAYKYSDILFNYKIYPNILKIDKIVYKKCPGNLLTYERINKFVKIFMLRKLFTKSMLIDDEINKIYSLEDLRMQNAFCLYK